MFNVNNQSIIDKEVKNMKNMKSRITDHVNMLVASVIQQDHLMLNGVIFLPHETPQPDKRCRK